MSEEIKRIRSCIGREGYTGYFGCQIIRDVFQGFGKVNVSDYFYLSFQSIYLKMIGFFTYVCMASFSLG